MIKIAIKDGIGSAEVKSGVYKVSSKIPGYDNSTIKPSCIKINDIGIYAFTIAATGTLTLHVTDECGKPIKNAKFIRTDKYGKTYGCEIESDCNGDAKFLNVPYGIDAPCIYFKQTASIRNYKFNDEIQSIKMTNKNETLNIKNYKKLCETFTVVDVNYDNIPVTGTLVLKK